MEYADAYLPSDTAHFKSQLLATKQKKAQAERDARLLANRITLLKKEEEKAAKKISDTRRRATEILRLREHNEARAAEKAALEQEQAFGRPQKQHSKNPQVEQSMRTNREKLLSQLEAQKRAGIAAVREDKQVRRAELQAARAQELEANQKRRAQVKAEEDRLRARRERERARIIAANRRAYEERIKREQEEVREREKELMRMEKTEEELLRRLKSTQIRQEAAYSELETALHDVYRRSSHTGSRPHSATLSS